MRLKMSDYIRHWDNENRKWIYEHREVMEDHLGRKLTSDEHVHHINGNTKDNRLENLVIVSKVEHMRIHNPVQFVEEKKCQVDGCESEHHAKGFCKTHYRREFPERHYSQAELDKGWRI